MMRSWIAEKLFKLAFMIDDTEVKMLSLELMVAYEWKTLVGHPKKKAGRPKGSKDKKPRKRPVRKVKS
jgi:hypothetical protein